MADIQAFSEASTAATGSSAVWCGSTEVYRGAHRRPARSLRRSRQGRSDSTTDIAPSRSTPTRPSSSGIPFANGAPNLTSTSPRCQELARQHDVPIAGKDFKTGQTLMKTILGAGFKARMLGLDGWYSTNILGNRDGEVLDDPESFKTKEVSKLGVLDTSSSRERSTPSSTATSTTSCASTTTRRRGDNKEGWDNIDIFGWLGYPMQIKIDFLCRDSILAAPIVLDLALFLDLARQRAG